MTEAEQSILSAITALSNDIRASNDAIIARVEKIEDEIMTIKTECNKREEVYVNGKDFLRNPPSSFSETVSLYAGRGLLIVIGGVILTYVYELVKILARLTTRQ